MGLHSSLCRRMLVRTLPGLALAGIECLVSHVPGPCRISCSSLGRGQSGNTAPGLSVRISCLLEALCRPLGSAHVCLSCRDKHWNVLHHCSALWPHGLENTSTPGVVSITVQPYDTCPSTALQEVHRVAKVAFDRGMPGNVSCCKHCWTQYALHAGEQRASQPDHPGAVQVRLLDMYLQTLQHSSLLQASIRDPALTRCACAALPGLTAPATCFGTATATVFQSVRRPASKAAAGDVSLSTADRLCHTCRHQQQADQLSQTPWHQGGQGVWPHPTGAGMELSCHPQLVLPGVS